MVHFKETRTKTTEPVQIETPKRVNKISDIFDALSDPLTIKMFMEGASNIKLGKDATRKQFYSRLEKLKEAGLICKRNGYYEMTSTGLVVKSALLLVQRALSYKMSIALRFYDTLRADCPDVPTDEWADKLFCNDIEIMDIVLNEKRVNVGVEPEEDIEVAVYEPE